MNPENQAIVAFIQSLIFVVAGACAQMGYQLRENGPWLLLSLKCLLYLLVAALLIQAFYYYRLIRNSRSQNKTIAKYTFITEVVVSVFIVLIGLWSFDQLRTSQALAENPNESTETSKWYNYRFVIEPASLSGVTAISGCNCSIRTSADAHESHKR